MPKSYPLQELLLKIAYQENESKKSLLMMAQMRSNEDQPTKITSTNILIYGAEKHLILNIVPL